MLKLTWSTAKLGNLKCGTESSTNTEAIVDFSRLLKNMSKHGHCAATMINIYIFNIALLLHVWHTENVVRAFVTFHFWNYLFLWISIWDIINQELELRLAFAKHLTLILYPHESVLPKQRKLIIIIFPTPTHATFWGLCWFLLKLTLCTNIFNRHFSCRMRLVFRYACSRN